MKIENAPSSQFPVPSSQFLRTSLFSSLENGAGAYRQRHGGCVSRRRPGRVTGSWREDRPSGRVRGGRGRRDVRGGGWRRQALGCQRSLVRCSGDAPVSLAHDLAHRCGDTGDGAHVTPRSPHGPRRRRGGLPDRVSVAARGRRGGRRTGIRLRSLARLHLRAGRASHVSPAARRARAGPAARHPHRGGAGLDARRPGAAARPRCALVAPAGHAAGCRTGWRSVSRACSGTSSEAPHRSPSRR